MRTVSAKHFRVTRILHNFRKDGACFKLTISNQEANQNEENLSDNRNVVVILCNLEKA